MSLSSHVYWYIVHINPVGYREFSPHPARASHLVVNLVLNMILQRQRQRQQQQQQQQQKQLQHIYLCCVCYIPVDWSA